MLARLTAKPRLWTVIAFFFAATVAGTGCFSQDPTETVTIEINGRIGDPDHLVERFRQLADSSVTTVKYVRVNDRMTLRLSPVEDVNAFAGSIDFAKVTEVKGRTLKVSL